MKKYRVVVVDNGSVYWYKFGTNNLHREDGPAIEFGDGSKAWYINGMCHREDGPALIRDSGTKLWFLNGKLHREDGPAMEYPDGIETYYIHGKRMTKEEFLARQQVPCDGKIVEIDGKQYKLTAV